MNPRPVFTRKVWSYVGLLLICVFLAQPTASSAAQATPPATQAAQGPGWQIKATLIPKGWTASTKAYLGWSVAIDGDTLVAGAPAKNNSVGAAEVFVRSGDIWTQQAELVAKDGKANDDFGYAVAISGDWILVGAPFKDNFTGHVYLFQRSGTSWTQQDLPQHKGVKAGDLLGWSVALAPAVASAATPAATGQAKAMRAHVNTGDIPAHSPNFQVTNGSIIAFAFGDPGVDQDAGGGYVGFFDEDNHHLSDVIPIVGDSVQPNDFVGAQVGFCTRQNGIMAWTAALGNTTFGEKFSDKFFGITVDINGVQKVPAIGGSVPLPDKSPRNIGASFVIDPGWSIGHLGGSSSVVPMDYDAQNTPPPILIVQAPVNKSNAVTGLEIYSFGADGTIKLVDNESPTVGGVMYGYAGATNDVDIALLGVDAKKKGSIGFFTIQNGKLVAGGVLPFSQETWQTVNPDGASNFAFSPDGNTLIAATLDAKTKTEAIAVLGRS